MAARRMVFRRSARLFALRLTMLMLVTFAGLAVLMHPAWQAALGISALAAAVASVWYYLTRHRPVSVTVDDEGIERTAREEPTRIRWVDVTEVAIGETELPQRGGAVPVRFCLVRGLGTRRIAFADLTYVDNRPVWVGAPAPTPLTDVADSDLLLGLVGARVGDERFVPAAPAPENDATRPEADAAEPSGEPRRLRPGLLALVLKLAANLWKPVVGLFKGTQGVLALASMGALALLFSWKGAVAIMLMLLFHEYGHVHAMRRTGMKVKGIYFIPLVGAAAVADDTWKSRAQQAQVALAGPLWGAVLTLLPFGLVLATGDRYPLAGAVAALWALINLFNLLPIAPLDGGRALSAVAYSVSSRLGVGLSVATLAAGVGLALWAGLHLFVLLLAIGLLEIAGERMAASRVRRLGQVPNLLEAPPEELTRLKVLTRPGFPPTSETKLREVENARAKRLFKLSRIEPMTARQAAFWFGAYVALSVALGGVLLWVARIFPELSALQAVLR